MATGVSLNGVDKATDDFYLAFGEALISWSYIEHRLLLWFWHLSGMSEGAARAVFFSAKGFRARADMLEALIRCDALPLRIRRLPTFEVALKFCALVIDKANNYSTYRNNIAHGLGIANATSTGAEILIVQGKKVFGQNQNDATNIASIKTMNANFQKLSVLISRGHQLFLTKNGNSAMFQEFREQVSLLPNVPYCEKLSRKQVGRMRQEKLASRKRPTSPQVP